LKTMTLSADREEDIARAAQVILRCGLLAFPTETVYGLGVRADRPEAVEKLLEVKGRPAEKKMAVLVDGIPSAESHAGALPPLARRIAEKFWPGPVTIVIETNDGETTGFRCPSRDAALRLVRSAGVPIAAPSANPSGLPPALTAQDVLAYFAGRIDAVLDGGPTELGSPSTVVIVRNEYFELIREGAVSLAEIQRAVG